MVLKTTCWDCNKRQKTFCRTNDIKKNSSVCESVQIEDYVEAKKKLKEN